jgi:hypothetical protein
MMALYNYSSGTEVPALLGNFLGVIIFRMEACLPGDDGKLILENIFILSVVFAQIAPLHENRGHVLVVRVFYYSAVVRFHFFGLTDLKMVAAVQILGIVIVRLG